MGRISSVPMFLGALVAAFSVSLQAQNESNAPQGGDLVGVWLLTIEGEANTRTLVIAEAATAQSGTFPGAKYGLSGGALPPVDARLSRQGETRQITVTTLASSIISVTEQADGSFKGSFTLKNGTVRPVLFTRVADGKLPVAAVKKEVKDPSAPVPPAPGTPADCAALFGNWAGTWSQGGFAEQYLRVVEVTPADAKCKLRFSYSGSKSPVPATLTAEASGGSFSFLCNRSTGGTCVMKLSGEKLWANYSDPAGGTNNASFRKVD